MQTINETRVFGRKTIMILVCVLIVSFLCSCKTADNTDLIAENTSLKAEIEKAGNEYSALETHFNEIQSENEKLKKESDRLQDDYTKLQSDYTKLQSEHNELVEATADWLTLSEEEKAAELAKAKEERIRAEEAAKKAEEEKAAAEKAAKEEAERKAAEEAAAREAEEKKGYNTGITFSDLARKPDDYVGKKVKFTGRALQVTEVDDEVQIRLATSKDSWGQYYDDVIYVYFDQSIISSRILEDDIITVYGVSKGLHTYTTVLGASVTLPLVGVDKVEN